MRKQTIFSIPAIICACLLYWLNCSKPLELEEIEQTPADTIFVPDTVVYVDTVYVDTSYTDTDTLYADTLICARLGSCRREIVWMFFNPEGRFNLEFQAIIERDHPWQTLIIDIDGQEYEWDLSDDLPFSLVRFLERHAIVRITSASPHGYGHAIDVCLRISAA